MARGFGKNKELDKIALDNILNIIEASRNSKDDDEEEEVCLVLVLVVVVVVTLNGNLFMLVFLRSVALHLSLKIEYLNIAKFGMELLIFYYFLILGLD